MKITSVLILFALPLVANAQTGKWNGHKSAVVLTYDDALNVHLDNVIPSLDSAGFKGTFYLTVSSGAFTNRMAEWKKVASNGHELGNHTMFHPCRGGTGDRSWVRPEYDLNNYTVKRVEDEIRMTNVILNSLDGKTQRTFAYPCGDMRAGGQFYIEAITDDFVGARGTEEKIMQYGQIDPFTVGCFNIAGQDAEYMIGLVRKVMKEGGLLVFLFHGVGGEHGLNVDGKEHQKLIDFVKQNEKEIWVAPFVDVIQNVKTHK